MIPYRVDIEIKKKIIQLRNDGLPITDVANEVGVAVSIVYYTYLQNLNAKVITIMI